MNDRRLVVRDYGYFVENRLRARYRLEGVPLVIDFVDRERRGRRAGRGVRRLGRLLRAQVTFDRIAVAVLVVGAVVLVASLGGGE